MRGILAPAAALLLALASLWGGLFPEKEPRPAESLLDQGAFSPLLRAERFLAEGRAEEALPHFELAARRALRENAGPVFEAVRRRIGSAGRTLVERGDGAGWEYLERYPLMGRDFFEGARRVEEWALARPGAPKSRFVYPLFVRGGNQTLWRERFDAVGPCRLVASSSRTVAGRPDPRTLPPALCGGEPRTFVLPYRPFETLPGGGVLLRVEIAGAPAGRLLCLPWMRMRENPPRGLAEWRQPVVAGPGAAAAELRVPEGPWPYDKLLWFGSRLPDAVSVSVVREYESLP